MQLPSWPALSFETTENGSGISQNTDASGIHKVQCMRAPSGYGRQDDTCKVVTMGVDYNGTIHSRWDTVNGAWDSTYQTGSCDGKVAGISRNVPAWDNNYGGGLHSILCCYESIGFGTP